MQKKKNYGGCKKLFQKPRSPKNVLRRTMSYLHKCHSLKKNENGKTETLEGRTRIGKKPNNILTTRPNILLVFQIHNIIYQLKTNRRLIPAYSPFFSLGARPGPSTRLTRSVVSNRDIFNFQSYPYCSYNRVSYTKYIYNAEEKYYTKTTFYNE